MDESKSQYLPYQKDDIKCNNFNLNANGFNVNAIPEPLSDLLQSRAETDEATVALVHLETEKIDLIKTKILNLYV